MANSSTTKLALPFLLTGCLGLIYWVLGRFVADRVDPLILDYLLTAFLVLLGIAVVRLISHGLFAFAFRKRKGREAPELLRLVVSIVGYALLFVIVYRGWLGRDLSTILATSAVVTVILGLALQDTLSNFFAGVSLHFEQPYYSGDAIRMGALFGKVVSVSWRTTTLRTNDNSIVIVPNNQIASEALEVFPLNNLNRRVLRFPAPLDTPPQEVIDDVRDAVQGVANVAKARTPAVRVHDYAESRTTFEVLYWTRDYLWTQDIDAQILRRVWYVLARSGRQIPVPLRHVFWERGRPGRGEATGDDYDQLIASVGILEPLSQEERAAVVGSLVCHLYAPGERIIRRGDPGDSMFVLRRGRAEVAVDIDGGGVRRVAELGSGDFFGEMALLTGEPRTADVSALDEVEILEIRKPAIRRLLEENEALAEAFTDKIAERQAELAELAEAGEDAEQPLERSTILRRIKRFFWLD